MLVNTLEVPIFFKSSWTGSLTQKVCWSIKKKAVDFLIYRNGYFKITFY